MFEPVPTGNENTAAAAAPTASVAGQAETYTVNVSGQSYVVEVAEGGDISAIAPVAVNKPAVSLPNDAGQPVVAPLAGNIFKVNVAAGERIQQGDVIIILEAMKMETEVRAAHSGVVVSVSAKEGNYVSVGDTLITVA